MIELNGSALYSGCDMSTVAEIIDAVKGLSELDKDNFLDLLR